MSREIESRLPDVLSRAARESFQRSTETLASACLIAEVAGSTTTDGDSAFVTGGTSVVCPASMETATGKLSRAEERVKRMGDAKPDKP